MTNRSAAALALKVWGVFWLVDALSGLVNTGLQLVLGHRGVDESLWMFAIRSNTLSWTFTFLIALGLVRGGDAIARALFPEPESLALGVDAPGLQAIAFSVLGLYFAFSALRGLSVGAYLLIAMPRQSSVRYALDPHSEQLVGAVVELAAAALLLFRAPALVRGLRRLQEPWTSRPAEPPPE